MSHLQVAAVAGELLPSRAALIEEANEAWMEKRRYREDWKEASVVQT